MAAAVIPIYRMGRNAFISGYRKDIVQTVICEVKHEKACEINNKDTSCFSSVCFQLSHVIN